MVHHQCEAVFARHLFFGTYGKDKIVVLWLCRQYSECLQQTHQTSSAVVAAKSIQVPVFYRRSERVSLPPYGRFYCVNVGIEHQGRFCGFWVLGCTNDIVTVALARNAMLSEMGAEEV